MENSTQKILVPLRGSDRLEHCLPHLERLARPGARIIFFVHYGLDGFSELMDHLLPLVGGSEPRRCRENGTSASVADILLDRLRQRGVQIEVNLYGLSKVLHEYVRAQEICAVFTPGGPHKKNLRALTRLRGGTALSERPT